MLQRNTNILEKRSEPVYHPDDDHDEFVHDDDSYTEIDDDDTEFKWAPHDLVEEIATILGKQHDNYNNLNKLGFFVLVHFFGGNDNKMKVFMDELVQSD
jgi:hypothetical protein